MPERLLTTLFGLSQLFTILKIACNRINSGINAHIAQSTQKRRSITVN